jgi:branched-chain amino acid transport system ATP-binding protein
VTAITAIHLLPPEGTLVPDRETAPPAAADPPTALNVTGLEVAYNEGTRALAGVDLSVDAGEIVALLGANGAGKSTLVRAITGLLPYYAGEVTRGHVELLGRPAPASAAAIVKLGVSQVMEGRRVFSDLTVGENLRAGGLSARGRDVHERHAKVLDRFPSLKRRENTAAGYLSGGEQQMLAIGRALMQDPALLLLDEPTLGLAPTVVGQIRDLVLELHADGTTILLIEQNVAMALEVSHRCYIMERGSITREGLSSELADDDAIRQAYLGLGAVIS